ncbi:DUF5710 domain-containing protein [Streptomyces uncialis]|uniref:DUF5710 domain-containing protein n=1 Tax=Streptomyces uncialis TaxID=1048205 RepID=UPI0022563BB6|nr:DUF5710 domain-containing protein [Streptomyces uncialis]MCX4659115.1 DUF5710 domain-containing protein [Streptomyces uncialis]
MVNRIWLDVPYAENDQAKAAGARWNPAAKRWYVPRKGMTALQPWAAAPDVPDLLPGEDRTLGEGLFVDLVPSSCWFTNVRSCVTSRDWERLRRMITRRAGMRCEACGAAENRDAKRWLEAHERWVYDDATRVQRLKRLICLCTDCHTVTRYGYAQVRGLETIAGAKLVSGRGGESAAGPGRSLHDIPATAQLHRDAKPVNDDELLVAVVSTLQWKQTWIIRMSDGRYARVSRLRLTAPRGKRAP